MFHLKTFADTLLNVNKNQLYFSFWNIYIKWHFIYKRKSKKKSATQFKRPNQFGLLSVSLQLFFKNIKWMNDMIWRIQHLRKMTIYHDMDIVSSYRPALLHNVEETRTLTLRLNTEYSKKHELLLFYLHLKGFAAVSAVPRGEFACDGACGYCALCLNIVQTLNNKIYHKSWGRSRTLSSACTAFPLVQGYSS